MESIFYNLKNYDSNHIIMTTIKKCMYLKQCEF